MITIKNKIIQEAAAYTGVSSKIITGRSRKRDNVMIRDAISVAIKEAYGMSDQSIANAIGRERSSVGYAQKRHAKRLESSTAYKVLFEHLLKQAQKGARA